MTIFEWLFTIKHLYILLAFIFGGGLATMIKTYLDGRQVATDTKIANMKAPVEIDAIQVTGLQVLVGKLQEDNGVLRNDRDYWKEQYEMVRTQVQKLSDELERQEQRNTRLRKEIDDLKARLANAEKNSPAHKAGRDDLSTEQLTL